HQLHEVGAEQRRAPDQRPGAHGDPLVLVDVQSDPHTVAVQLQVADAADRHVGDLHEVPPGEVLDVVEGGIEGQITGGRAGGLDVARCGEQGEGDDAGKEPEPLHQISPG